LGLRLRTIQQHVKRFLKLVKRFVEKEDGAEFPVKPYF